MRQLLAWIFVSFGVGTVVGVIRWLAVYYIVRRMRRALPRRRQT